MTDEPALLAAILADRADDTVRLAYADWLDENGQPERAEFVRVQVEIGRFTCESIYCVGCESCGGKNGGLRRRERELLDAHGYEWCDIGGGWKTDGREKCGNVVVVRYYTTPDSYGRYEFTFARGFAEQVECPWVCWHLHADAITARQPIERVTITDRPIAVQLSRRIDATPSRLDQWEKVRAWHEWEMSKTQQDPRALDREFYKRCCEAVWPRITFEVREPASGLQPGDVAFAVRNPRRMIHGTSG